MEKAIILKSSEALVHPVEVVMPSEEAITRLINERIADMLADARTADLQPFFAAPEVAAVMRRSQTLIERRKWIWYFEEWGCLVDGARDARHAGLGMCPACLSRTRERLNRIKRQHAPEAATEAFRDSLRLAREALRGGR